ncbi:anaphase-promoting complex subunit 6 isoform X2 [Drosophila mojavensis]|uniref:Uncharacterized protein, isoform B n=1 Tax=Drosophila mojavensis TaxID=7230 RepID=A0A0Q9WY45_DROMO|nr:anaphase-promoting complex subunit 6 isoform X2 [Drosophila mojavensis]KRF94180.1 uncharacterized protein Dmoj_GI15912, isoform B [Drosophila mojavensis]
MDSHHVRNTEFWKEFFRLYRSMPELWLTNSKDYRNRKLKAHSYDRLLRHMRTSDPYANIHMVKRKINNLRTSYRRELRKVLESRANGAYSGEEYVPSLWYFNELEFLYDQETGEAQTLIDAEPEHEPDSKPEPEQESEPEYLKDAYNENVVEVSLEEQEPVSGIHATKFRDEDIFAEPFPPEEDMLVIEGEADAEGDIEGDDDGEGDGNGNGDGDGDVDNVVEAEDEENGVKHGTLSEARHKCDPKMESKYQQHSHSGNNNSNSNNNANNHNHNNNNSISGAGKHVHPHPYATVRLQPQQQQQSQSRRSMRRRQHSTDDDGDYGGESTATVSKKRRQMMMERSIEHTESECDLIGKRMAAHFRNMRPDQRLFAERIISEVLVFGRMNRLSLDARFLPNGTGGDLFSGDNFK